MDGKSSAGPRVLMGVAPCARRRRVGRVAEIAYIEHNGASDRGYVGPLRLTVHLMSGEAGLL